MPYAKPGQEHYLVKQLSALLKRHPSTTIIWAHCGLGRIIRPIEDQLKMLAQALADPALRHVHIDISWMEVAKYIMSSPASIKETADLINRYPDRFLFGTDEMAPANQEQYLKVYNTYEPLLKQLNAEASRKLLKENYARIFDAARIKVRKWEAAHVKK